MSLIVQATEFATKKHDGQVRKFNGEPYIEHPKRVAWKVFEITHNDELTAAAVLHDTLEDTDTSLEELVSVFGNKIAYLVMDLTNNKEGMKELGKEVYLTKKMSNLSSNALLIKLADRLDNVSDLSMENETWSRTYATQTKYILDNLCNPDFGMFHETLCNEIREKIAPFI